MTQQQKWLQVLGLAYRARKCISGEELVTKEIQKQNVDLVILSLDASDNTKKKIEDKCNFYNIPIRYALDRHQLGYAIGKDARVVVAIADKGFSKKLLQLLDE